jgi:hypothetical protein
MRSAVLSRSNDRIMSIITAIGGIVLFMLSLFFAFGTGIEKVRESDQVVFATLMCLMFACVSIFVFLVRP